jgi:hypothetical protein
MSAGKGRNEREEGNGGERTRKNGDELGDWARKADRKREK